MSTEDPIIVVSGLPRSGTSLMMQILRAGGISLLTDARRPADASNPRGYFEYEKVKWLAADNSWLAEARGKALKVIAQLLPFLPPGFRYQVLLMRRDMEEVIRSQATMIEALGKSVANDPRALVPIFEGQLAVAQAFIRTHPRMTSETVDYRELIQTPEATIDRTLRFLERSDLDRLAMIGTIDRTLYRSISAANGQ